MTSLYRKEAIDGSRQRFDAGPVLIKPPPPFVLTGFLASGVALALAFATTGTYARKETVPGHLSPDRGIIRVYTPRTGVVGSLQVAEGDIVAAGDTLLTLAGERTTADGVDVELAQLDGIDARLAEIDRQAALESRRRRDETARLEIVIADLGDEIAALDRRIALQAAIVGDFEADLDALRGVVRDGYVSDDAFRARRIELLAARQQLAGLEQERAATARRLHESEAALLRVPIDSDQRLAELRSASAQAARERTEIEARASLAITAPVPGRVTALAAYPGAAVTPGLPALTILPQGGRLEAHLYVPTRAIGFVRPGQEVRLLLDAFDFRRFGSRGGRVTSVSSSVYLPAEARFGPTLREPAYRVTVRLSEQSILAYGREFFLRAGMTLRADIVLERRSLLDWLLDPLASIRGRR